MELVEDKHNSDFNIKKYIKELKRIDSTFGNVQFAYTNKGGNLIPVKTLEEIGQIFDVTRERIRQIEAKALRKLRHPNRNGVLKEYIK